MATFKKTGKYKQKQFNCYSNVLFRKILKEIEATNSQLQQLFVLYFTCISGKTKLFSYPLWFSAGVLKLFWPRPPDKTHNFLRPPSTLLFR